jgi:hypothetical protein
MEEFKGWLAGQLIQIYYKMTEQRPCTQSGFAKKRTLKQNSAKKSTNIQKIEFWQASND